MANTSSAIKKIRVDARRKKQNDAARRAYKEAIKDTVNAASNGDPKETLDASKTAYKKIDKAAKIGVLHQGTAARLKSRLMKKVSTASK